MLNIILIIAIIALLYFSWVNASDENAWMIVLPTIPGTWLLYRLGIGFPINILLAGFVSLGILIWGTIRNERAAKEQSAREKPFVKPQSPAQKPAVKPQSPAQKPAVKPQSRPVPSAGKPVQKKPATFADSLVRTDADVYRERECIRYEINRIIESCKEKSRQQTAIGKRSCWGRYGIVNVQYAQSASYMEAVRSGVERELKDLGFSRVSVHTDPGYIRSLSVGFDW